ncbi:hypothetical protein Ae201684P_012195 [Aphanomyces euteiches]|nr:hypothetical protein Ae201684P_012195 [Aphanomyces euteiches]
MLAPPPAASSTRKLWLGVTCSCQDAAIAFAKELPSNGLMYRKDTHCSSRRSNSPNDLFLLAAQSLVKSLPFLGVGLQFVFALFVVGAVAFIFGVV